MAWTDAWDIGEDAHVSIPAFHTTAPLPGLLHRPLRNAIKFWGNKTLQRSTLSVRIPGDTPSTFPIPLMRLLLGLAASSTLVFSGLSLVDLPPANAKPVKCPDTWDGIKCDYYRDGHKAGKDDRKAGMSMAYERHDGAYDTRNASYYQAGYEDGWNNR